MRLIISLISDFSKYGKFFLQKVKEKNLAKKQTNRNTELFDQAWYVTLIQQGAC